MKRFAKRETIEDTISGEIDSLKNGTGNIHSVAKVLAGWVPELDFEVLYHCYPNLIWVARYSKAFHDVLWQDLESYVEDDVSCLIELLGFWMLQFPERDYSVLANAITDYLSSWRGKDGEWLGDDSIGRRGAVLARMAGVDRANLYVVEFGEPEIDIDPFLRSRR